MRTALATNPFLEYDASKTEDVALATDSSLEAGDTIGAPVSPAAETVAAVPAPESTDASSNDDDSSSDYSGDSFERGSSRHSNVDSEGSDPADWARAQPTLHEQLPDALRPYPLHQR